MKIALGNWFANRRGGADVYTRFLALSLAQAGHEVHFLGYEADADVTAAVQVHPLQKPEIRGWRWRLAARIQAKSMARQLGVVNLPVPDVIIASPPFLVRPLRRRFPGVPVVYLPHARISPVEVAGYLPGRPGSWFHRRGVSLYARHEREALLEADAIVRFVPSAARALEDYYQLSLASRMHIIPLPMPLAGEKVRLDPARPTPGCRLLTVGRLIPSKNLAALLDWLSTPVLRHQDWQLDIVGEGPERETLLARIQTLGLTERVRLHGQQDDLTRFYAQADLFLFPSLLENTPLVILEAMAAGVPVLALKADGLRILNSHEELFQQGIEGWLAYNESDFVRVLESQLRAVDPTERFRRGQAAREAIRTRHDPDIVVKHWLQLLGTLHEASARPRSLALGAARV